ncbi:SO4C1 protein, partial [Centropus bengalensis]|nr:SO4C1 protein [Centropus bengalensis]
MRSSGIENPVFEPPSSDFGRELQASPAGACAGDPVAATAEEGPCGWGRCVPKALQLCNNPEGYLAAYSLLAIFQGNAPLPPFLERQVYCRRKILMTYLLLSLRWPVSVQQHGIMCCIILHPNMGVLFLLEKAIIKPMDAFITSVWTNLPKYLLHGKYFLSLSLSDTCQVPGTSSTNFTCSTSTKSSLHNYLYIFILGQLLLGVGGTPLYTLGTTFIDDSVPKHKSSLYIGIGYAMSLLGPAIGYVLGGQLLNIYIDIQIPERQENHLIFCYMDQDDPRWLGAWWIAFLACFFAIWLLIIPFSCFPKRLPGTARIQAEKISETHNDGSEAVVETQNIGKSFKDFPVAILILLKNPVLMSLIIASSSEALVATGFATFLPKFIENQFGKSSRLVLIPAAALGQIISGILVSKCKMDCKSIIRFMIGTCSVALLLNTVFLFAKCGNEPFAGVSETYNGTGMLYNLTAPCNANCRCLRSMYYPVCGRDEVQYFSPCFAGCASRLFNNMKKVHYPMKVVG